MAVPTVVAVVTDWDSIQLFPARGSTTGIDWHENTVRQLTGGTFHELILGKPFADIFVDDRAIHSDTYLWE